MLNKELRRFFGVEMEFARLVKSTREKKYETPTQFHQEAQLPCSYFYYTKIEKGKLPEIDLAMAIISALEINLRKGLYAWVRDQMPNPETKALFTEVDHVPTRSTEQMSARRSLVVNRMQAKLLQSNPIYWEVMLFISCYHEEKNFTAQEISRDFRLKVPEMRKLLDDLYEYGLVDKLEDGRYSTKEWLYIPYDEEFDEIRQINFERAVNKFLRPENSNDRYRTTITRLVTPEQKNQIKSYIDALTNTIVDLPDTPESKGRVPFTIGVFASPRRFGNA